MKSVAFEYFLETLAQFKAVHFIENFSISVDLVRCGYTVHWKADL